jgi:hypothetical protein
MQIKIKSIFKNNFENYIGQEVFKKKNFKH